MEIDSDPTDPPHVKLTEEGAELPDHKQDSTVADPDQSLSEEQIYQETVRGIRSYMGWRHISDLDSSASLADDQNSD